MQLQGKANWIIVGANYWRREREVTFVRLAYAAQKTKKMCGDGHCFNVSYKTRQWITHQFMPLTFDPYRADNTVYY